MNWPAESGQPNKAYKCMLDCPLAEFTSTTGDKGVERSQGSQHSASGEIHVSFLALGLVSALERASSGVYLQGILVGQRPSGDSYQRLGFASIFKRGIFDMEQDFENTLMRELAVF